MSAAALGFAGASGSGETSRRKPLLPNAVLATLVFVITEAIFFSALVSAYVIIKAGTGNTWVPPENVRLPVATTALNTVILSMSGLLIFLAGRQFANPAYKERATRTYLGALTLGVFFVSFQGYEWVKLIQFGMTLQSGLFGATFFLLIGTHGLHALSAVLAMSYVYYRMKRGTLTPAGFTAMRIFWYFIVGVWPLLYGLVYF